MLRSNVVSVRELNLLRVLSTSHSFFTKIYRLTASNSFAFRSGENKDEQDLSVRQKTNASEDCNSADIMSAVVGLTRQAGKHRSDSKPNDSEMTADESQCERAEQTVHRLLVQSETCTVRRREHEAAEKRAQRVQKFGILLRLAAASTKRLKKELDIDF